MDIKLRENWSTGKVDVYKDGNVVFSSREYKFAAEYTMRNLGVHPANMDAIFRDYKDDYDNA